MLFDYLLEAVRPATTTNTTAQGNDSTSGGNNDSGPLGSPVDPNEEPPTDYNTMGNNDSPTDTTTGRGTDSTPGGDAGTGGDPNEEPPTDYGAMGDNDSPAGGADTTGGDTDATPGGGDPNEEPPTDYGAMGDDNDPETTDYSGINQDSPAAGTDVTPGGDAGTGGDPNEEPPTDYGAMSDSDDSSGDGSSGGDDQSSTDNISTDSTDTTGTDPTQELRDMEAKLFSDLSPTQIQIKDNELKTQFINLYEDIDSTIQRVNRIVKTDANQEVVAFLSRKLDELKELAYSSLVDTYQTQTYIQNLMMYNTLLANYASIGQMLVELSKKDSANDDIKDDNKDDTDDEMFSSTMDDNRV